MGHKVACLTCHKSFNISLGDDHTPENCPDCGNKLAIFNHTFRPPKKTDIKAWNVIEFLYKNGFNYQHIYKDISKSSTVNKDSNENYADYPTNMKDAKEFVSRYRSQARELSK